MSEPLVLRAVAPVVAGVLAVVVLCSMVALGPGALRSWLVVGGIVATGVLFAARAWVGHRAGRSYRTHQVLVAWPVQAGLTWLAAGEDSAVSALAYVLTGSVFAVLLVGFLAFADARSGDDGTHDGERPADTAPLPMAEP